MARTCDSRRIKTHEILGIHGHRKIPRIVARIDTIASGRIGQGRAREGDIIAQNPHAGLVIGRSQAIAEQIEIATAIVVRRIVVVEIGDGMVVLVKTRCAIQEG